MPELPEVETIVRDLKKKVLKRTFLDVWTDAVKIIKKPKKFKDFKRLIKNKKILKIKRRGKNIIFELSGGLTLLVHQKLTGHLLYGKWAKKKGKWTSLSKGVLRDPVNRFLHLIFFLDNKKMLALSDLRKFAKVELWQSKEIIISKLFLEIGPEPLEKSFTFRRFKEVLTKKKNGQKRKGKIKQILMDQSVVAGIGNIYSDEILFSAKIHPLKDVSSLSEKDLRKTYSAMRKILKKAVLLKGESFSDFRTLSGEKGNFDAFRKAYKREGEKCFNCKTPIQRIKVGGRSACFCPSCQLL